MDAKQLLEQAALTLFSAKGYEGVGVQEIVDHVSLTKPTLYHYFGSKDGLFRTIIARGVLPLEQELILAARYAGDLTGTLSTIARCYFTFLDRHPVFYRLWLAIQTAPTDSIMKQLAAPYLEHQIEVIETVFQQAVRDHGNMDGRSTIYTMTFIGMINSIANLVLDGTLEIDEGMLYRVLHQFEHGIYS
ncbi:MAG: TetR/AcrR family transcriptional regulator [Anaerolineae bacterium]|nr:TetR/AcrR family transcriptional regulator [Anaerolineae bacterium]